MHHSYDPKCKVNMLIWPSVKLICSLSFRQQKSYDFLGASLCGSRSLVWGKEQCWGAHAGCSWTANCGDGFYIWTKLTATKLFVTQHKSEIVTDENMNLTSVCFCTFATHKKYPGLNWLQFLKLNYGIEFCINIRRWNVWFDRFDLANVWTHILIWPSEKEAAVAPPAAILHNQQSALYPTPPFNLI